MASPQLENGHSRLANELLEAIMMCPPATVPARQIWDWVWRESWGRSEPLAGAPCSPADEPAAPRRRGCEPEPARAGTAAEILLEGCMVRAHGYIIRLSQERVNRIIHGVWPVNM